MARHSIISSPAAAPPPRRPTGLAALRLGRRDEQWDHDEWIRVSKFAVGCTCILQKLNKQLAHLFRLLLLQPVTGSVYKVGAAHLRAGGILHGLERARALENAPIAFAANE